MQADPTQGKGTQTARGAELLQEKKTCSAQTLSQNKVKDQQLAENGGVTVQSTIYTK